MFLNSPGGGAPSNAPYLTDGAVAGLDAERNINSLAVNLTFKGDAAAQRTLTFGQQVANADLFKVDVPFANAKINNSEIMCVGATQTNTAAKTFNDQTLKFRNPGNTFSFT